MAVTPETAPARAPVGEPRWRRFLHRRGARPPDQPAWARPALLAIAVLAAVAYGWGMAGASVEPFYGAAARSMSESWHDFIFGAFDPAGTVTVDKLPGALWMQALSLRVFGFHIWALVLPQVIEGVLTILVLYRAVRRLAGPAAGLTAAAVLAVTPITVLLSRGNVSDSLLILLLVLAADATSAALLTGSLRPLLIAGVWVGLAFQAKMIQAWLALPALAAAYLLAAPAAPAANPLRPCRAGRAGHRRGLAVVDDGGLAGPVGGPAVRGRQRQRLGVHAGLRLQRPGPADRELGDHGRAAVADYRLRRSASGFICSTRRRWASTRAGTVC